MELINNRDLESIVKKAWEDSVFKNSLVQNPVAIIEGFLGRSVNLPANKKLVFVDQTDTSTIFINIPVKPNMEDVELNDEQLDAVAGGTVDPILIKPS